MFTLLESKEEIAEAHAQLLQTIEANWSRIATKNIGYPGGTTYGARVYTDGAYWFWPGDLKASETPNPRKLNWFGLFSEDTGLQITVEINTPYIGSNGQIAGSFARHSEDGRVYLLHSGRVGGGTKGVGKSAFLAWSNHSLVPVRDQSDQARYGVVVMPISGRGAIRPAMKYIQTIVGFKEAVRSGEIDNEEFREKLRTFEEYYSEPSGRRKGKRKSNIDYYSRHGDVVDALYQLLTQRGLPKNSLIVKNAQIDLGVEINGKLSQVYEVKTNSTRYDAYTALGQLMVHSESNNCKKIMLLPHPSNLPSDISAALKRLEVDLMEYELTESEVTII